MHTRRSEVTALGLSLLLYGLFTFLTVEADQVYSWSDSEGYYLYLPALTKYGFADLPLRSEGQFQRSAQTGRYYDKYTAGVALMQAPFYSVAYLVASIDGKWQADGYSRPFQRGILGAALFYGMLGLLITYRFLRQYVGSLPSVATILCIYFGTNLWYYTHREPGMSHAYAFFLWSVVLWYSRLIHKDPRWKNFLPLSLAISLLVYIRPTDALAVIIILFWDITTLRERIRQLSKNALKYLSLLIPFLFFSVIQILLWSHMHGSPVFFSYNAEPGFIYFLQPKLASVLFHVHNGLFIYAPILLLSIAGLLVGLSRKDGNHLVILAVFCLATYLFGSWWAWWFGGAYGHRCFVDLLPLLAFPLAQIFQYVNTLKSPLPAVAVCAVSVFCIYYSVKMTIAYRSPWDGPGFGWKEYWEIVDTQVF